MAGCKFNKNFLYSQRVLQMFSPEPEKHTLHTSGKRRHNATNTWQPTRYKRPSFRAQKMAFWRAFHGLSLRRLPPFARSAQTSTARIHEDVTANQQTTARQYTKI